MYKERLTIVTVPCFSGAPWNLEQLKQLSHRPLRTMRLPERLDDVEDYADFVAEQVFDLSSYILVGDSFGAVISLALATRQPEGLKGLVLSRGFASNPVTDPIMKLKIMLARFLPGPLYRAIQATKRMRAGIPHVVEVVLPRTGHMFRYSHPETYGAAIEAFIQKSAIYEPRVQVSEEVWVAQQSSRHQQPQETQDHA